MFLNAEFDMFAGFPVENNANWSSKVRPQTVAAARCGAGSVTRSSLRRCVQPLAAAGVWCGVGKVPGWAHVWKSLF